MKRNFSTDSVIDLLVLATLAKQPLHGFGILESLHKHTHGAFHCTEGTIYPSLYRLERLGILKSHSTRHAGRKRRVYQITKRGRTVLAQTEASWKRKVHAVGLALRAAE